MKIKFPSITHVREAQAEAKAAGWEIIHGELPEVNCLWFCEAQKTVFETSPMGNELLKYTDYTIMPQRTSLAITTFLNFKKRKK